MFKIALFIGVAVLILPSTGPADCGCASSVDEGGIGYGYDDVAGPIFWFGPGVVVLDGATHGVVVGPGGATFVQCTCAVSSETGGTGSQGAHLCASNVTFVSGDGVVWVDSEVVIVVWQSQP